MTLDVVVVAESHPAPLKQGRGGWEEGKGLKGIASLSLDISDIDQCPQPTPPHCLDSQPKQRAFLNT